MEPTLTPPDPADDPLEALLRSAPPLIPDDGFTARVCAALPLREAAVPRSVRWPVLAGATLLGSVLAWWILSDAGWGLVALRAMFDAALGWMIEPWHALPTLLVLTIWAAAAVSRDEWEGGVLTRG